MVTNTLPQDLSIGNISYHEDDSVSDAQLEHDVGTIPENEIEIMPEKSSKLSIDEVSMLINEQKLASLIDDFPETSLSLSAVSDITANGLSTMHKNTTFKAVVTEKRNETHDYAIGTLHNLNIHRTRDSFFSPITHKPYFDPMNISHVRRPKLKSLLLKRRFIKYANRFANCQRKKTLQYPTLCQPINDEDEGTCNESVKTREKHRFVITADTQFGILMDGFPMANPNWSNEIEISRRAVEKINDMKGDEKPLFVCMCGDLFDTEDSFSTAIASWKKMFKDWERDKIFDQQVNDWKQVWSNLDEDIALVCLCGNHDVGNRPTKASIEKWRSSFGDDYLAFWVNGTYNIGMNNCIFSNPTGVPEMFVEQLEWLEQRLKYAYAKGATQIFVYSHYPWFLINEDDEDKDVAGVSLPPSGWGPPGAKFNDSYFQIPIEQRKIALSLFKEYGVTACFSGHFHQNVVAKTSWGMDMIVTASLSMNLTSTYQHIMSKGLEQNIGFRVVDVAEDKFTHNFIALDAPDFDASYFEGLKDVRT